MEKETLPIGTRLAMQRRKLGLTQEQVQEQTGITTRTIQRIEGNKVQPQAHTLKTLAACLQLDFSALTQPLTPRTERAAAPPASQLALLHASSLVGLLVPFANIIAPLLFWLLKRAVHPEYDQQGRKVLNFQCTITLIGFISIVLLVLYFPVGYPMILLTYLYSLIVIGLNIRNALQHRPVRFLVSIPFIPLRAKSG